MYNEKQQQVVDAFLTKIQARTAWERANGGIQDHDNREYLVPIREVINLYGTDQMFTPDDVIAGLCSWASSMAHKEMKRIAEHSYDHPVDGRILECISDHRFKYCWMDAE